MRLQFPALLFAALLTSHPGQAQDVAAGEKVFKKCATCHKVGEGAKNGPGPILNNVIGRQAGTAEGFRNYGKDLIALGEAGLVWNAELIEEWITDPKAFLKARSENPRPKSKMKFKLRDAEDRANVVAYIAQFSDAADMEMEESATLAPTDDTAMIVPAENELCVLNASDDTFFFAVETKQGERITSELAGGKYLCTKAAEKSVGGTVSVFETADHLEGCSRLVSADAVAVGYVEEMRRYADFDRCLWSSNAS